ncbi:hypothetical protein UY3_06720 [Chelonia mydas]|uniref:Uncharacterized protein n=1 Tax=Chelonia mydas TaxID=8469 RepID=M7BFX7_CHEMY|nr:hypothetical protein UY3_06720 [Chelonia mydas]
MEGPRLPIAAQTALIMAQLLLFSLRGLATRADQKLGLGSLFIETLVTKFMLQV